MVEQEPEQEQERRCVQGAELEAVQRAADREAVGYYRIGRLN